VLYGATGYMGRLTTRAMVAGGARPVLAGRDPGRLNALAAQLSRTGDGIELETAVADSRVLSHCGGCSGPATCWCRPRDRS
jgi:short subunit dehydrogenase-like uncharacterized protein